MPQEPRPGHAPALPTAPRGLSGEVAVPPSKSITQRALVAAALAGQGSRVRSPLDAEDPRLLLDALRCAGYRLTWDGEGVLAAGVEPRTGGTVMMGNNGTGARFILAQLAATPGAWLLDGVPRLRERPFGALVAALRELGADVTPTSGAALALPLRVAGRALAGGEVRLDPAASSQFISALLLLGARLPRGLLVRLTAPPPSRPYLALTVDALRRFGGDAGYDEREMLARIAPGPLRPTTFAVEGDWSAAAFPLAAVAVAGGAVELLGLGVSSLQGDAAILGLVEAAGCGVSATPRGVAVEGPASRQVRADLRDTPDLFPALAVMVAVLGGRLSGLEGLAAKESDRLGVMAANLRALGFPLAASAGEMTAPGARPPGASGLVLPCAADHRIAMAMAVAGTVVPGMAIDDPGCVAKSWPGFWETWRDLVAGRS